ncbi:AMP-binding protein [Priestia filamentosa]|uniref:AMP-binding protein n=1 Tax=Priestia filamentosa TaxID=1402861 RepID=UPI001FB49A27|nr:AMP-binding protein [Priestia filamentosa]UOE58258.1 AMP-binding protein [Priestia filamentosa]
MSTSTDTEKIDNLCSIFMTIREEREKGITFIKSSKEQEKLSYYDLYRKSLKMLSTLQQRGLTPGDKVIFQIPDRYNEDFIVLFWACILGRIIPVPLSVGTNNEHLDKFFRIFSLLKEPYIATTEEVLQNLQHHNEEFTNRNLIDKSILLDNIELSDQLGTIQEIKGEDIAFIQFSSGSTGTPKGVILTHNNLITNVKSIIDRLNITYQDRYLSWMPLTHDMGLIGLHLTAVMVSCEQFIMPTSLFIIRPTLWMKKVSEFRSTITASPNFGIKYFLSYYKKKSLNNFDLSSVRVLGTGAEPISMEVCEKFIDELRSTGLDENVFAPCYGLAEATVCVTMSNTHEGLKVITLNRKHLKFGSRVIDVEDDHPDSIPLIDVGLPVKDCYIRVTNHNNEVVDEGIIGNIEVKGESVTPGYINGEINTKDLYTYDGWLKTGDLGFLRNGHLIVTGRRKDIILINGQNYYPHDIERICERVDGVGFGNVVACGIYSPTLNEEELTLFLKLKGKKHFSEVVQSLKSAVASQFGIEVRSVIPINNVPKTTSGKYQRYKLKEIHAHNRGLMGERGVNI